MTTVTVRAGLDTYANSEKPGANYGPGRRLWLKADSREAYVFFKSPVPRGASVASAILRFNQAGAETGTITLTAKRVADSWKTRRLDWNNRPGVVGVGAQATKTDPAHRATWELDVTTHLQRIADGAPNYGFKITTSHSTLMSIFSLNADVGRPTLEVTYSDRPDAPTTLIPSGGAVSVAKPVLRFDYSDPGGQDALEAVQVQIDAAGDFSAPDFDSGWLDATEPELDLTETTYAGLTDGASTSWRVRVRDASGLESKWSDPATFSRAVKGTLTITNPAAAPNNYVDEFTPPIAWSYTGTQTAYRVLISKVGKPQTHIHDSGKRSGSATTYTLPKGVLRDDEQYRVKVRVWDDKQRVGTPGDPIFIGEQRDFVMNYDPTVDEVTGLSATQLGEAPWIQLTWSRGTMPDEWIVKRDGKVVAHIDPASDAFVSGTSYSYTDYGADPMRQHTYRVLARVGARTSTENPSAVISTAPVGVWIADFENGLYAKLRSLDVENVENGEDAATMVALGGETVIRRVVGMRGLEGSMRGIIEDTDDGRSWRQHEADLLEMKSHPSSTFRLVFADLSIPVILGNVTISPSRDTLPNHVQKRVTFDFWQNGELPFEAEL